MTVGVPVGSPTRARGGVRPGLRRIHPGGAQARGSEDSTPGSSRRQPRMTVGVPVGSPTRARGGVFGTPGGLMFEVLRRPQLARPAAARELPCRMRGRVLPCVEGHLLPAGLQFRRRTGLVTQCPKGVDERSHRLFARHVRGPVADPILIGPPPGRHDFRRPGDAVVAGTGRAGDRVGRACQPGEALRGNRHVTPHTLAAAPRPASPGPWRRGRLGSPAGRGRFRRAASGRGTSGPVPAPVRQAATEGHGDRGR